MFLVYNINSKNVTKKNYGMGGLRIAYLVTILGSQITPICRPSIIPAKLHGLTNINPVGLI